jgi:hypothetical protein
MLKNRLRIKTLNISMGISKIICKLVGAITQ